MLETHEPQRGLKVDNLYPNRLQGMKAKSRMDFFETLLHRRKHIKLKSVLAKELKCIPPSKKLCTSSSRSTFGFLTRALAIAMRCKHKIITGKKKKI